MATVNPYLTFHGQCEEAFKFYESAFGKTVPFWGRFGEMPPAEGMPPLADEYKNQIMHVSLQISKETTLMGSDSLPGMGEYKQGNDFSVSINTDSREEALTLYQIIRRWKSDDGTSRHILGCLFRDVAG